MATRPGKMLRDLQNAFTSALQTMSNMHAAVQVNHSAQDVIISAGGTDHTASFTCRPVVCRLPERASARDANLYVIFRGRLEVCVTADHPTTLSYATDFGYFKFAKESVSHLLGGHYDFADSEIAHPRAHLQIASQADLWEHAGSSFRNLTGVPIGDNPMERVLNRVRAPSAQMDFLSFMTQLTADHLVEKKSAAEVRKEFHKMLGRACPFGSYEPRPVGGLCDCHRATHWYSPDAAAGS